MVENTKEITTSQGGRIEGGKENCQLDNTEMNCLVNMVHNAKNVSSLTMNS